MKKGYYIFYNGLFLLTFSCNRAILLISNTCVTFQRATIPLEVVPVNGGALS